MAANPPVPPTEAERLARLRLIRSENVGPVTFRHLLARYGSASAALDRLPELARRGGRTTRLKIPSLADAEREIEENAAAGARVVITGDPDYPPLLAEIEDAPPILSLIGHAHLLLEPSVAMVGARNASGNAMRFAEMLARDLGAHGHIVVSGLARGIDTAAHQGALATGTVAVVAGGIDIVYPPENAALRARIAAEGVILAEVAVGTRPLARHFPARNRIIAGIARATVVVEAARRSGSLITARFAADQGREVCAVPGSPLDPRCQGSNGLLRDGAHLVESAEDVLMVLMESGVGEERDRLYDAGSATSPAHSDAPEIDEPTRRGVLELLDASPLAVDEIIRRCQFSAPVVLTILLEAELAGEVERYPGNCVARRFAPP